jgi:peptidylprolyl isomerase
MVKRGDTVSVHYTGTLDDGTIFDTSEGGPPLVFTVGSGQVISGFEDGVLGMEIGETRDITIPPEQAYGEYHEELVGVVPRSFFPSDVNPAIGLSFELQLQSGETLAVRIIDIEGDDIVLDANHPLAGETLHFKVRLVGVS